MPRDPSVGIALPRRRRAEAAIEFPTSRQVGAVLAAAGETLRPFVALCAPAGVRSGEAAALRVEDVGSLAPVRTTSAMSCENWGGWSPV